MDRKTIIILVTAVIVILIACGTAFLVLNNHSEPNNETAINSTENITEVAEDAKASQPQKAKAHGYCAICGAPLSLDEATDEYTQGKVCWDCARNPYYQTDPGAAYANEKLEEAYPEDYNGIADEYYDDEYYYY